MDKRTVESIAINRVMDMIGDVTKAANSIKIHLKNGNRLTDDEIMAIRDAEKLLVETKEKLALGNPIKIKKVEKKTIPGFSMKKIS